MARNLVNFPPELQRNVETVQKIPPKHQRVQSCQHGVDPAGGNEKRLAGAQVAHKTVLHLVAEKSLAFVGRFHPIVEKGQISGRGFDYVE